MAKPQEIEVLVSQRDFEAALAELVPSVSEAEMAHYRVVQVSVSVCTPDLKLIHTAFHFISNVSAALPHPKKRIPKARAKLDLHRH